MPQQARHWIAQALLITAAGPAAAVTLHDAALGSLPSAQGWTLGTSGLTSGTQSVSGGTYKLDTTAADAGYGNGRFSSVGLNTASGFQLTFSLQVGSETHSDNNRAGYSVIVVGADPTKSLELAFWGNHIWAYDYVPGGSETFVHGALDVAFDTTAALRTYTLTVSNQQFTLSTGATPLLSDALRDYTAQGGPYGLPSLLFFGDDTSRGTSVTQLGLVTVSAVPEPTPALLLAAGLAVLARRRR